MKPRIGLLTGDPSGIGPEVAATERAGELIGEVEIHFAEDRGVVVLAHLLRQPQRVRPAGDFEIGAEAIRVITSEADRPVFVYEILPRQVRMRA